MYTCRICGVSKQLSEFNSKPTGNRHKSYCIPCDNLKSVWYSMHRRCYNTHGRDFNRWGGRGITVCNEWLSFDAFREWSLDNDYEAGLLLDRKNNTGNYEPANCRWATSKQQQNNLSNNVVFTIDGVTKPLQDWCDDFGKKYQTVYSRLRSGKSSLQSLRDPIKS